MLNTSLESGALRIFWRGNHSFLRTRVTVGVTMSLPVEWRVLALHPNEPPTSTWIKNFLISHAHLDHIGGLIIGAGSTSSSSPRYIAGTETVVRDIELCLEAMLG